MSMEDMSDKVSVEKNIDQYSRFLKPTIPKGQFNYYNPILPTLGKELSIGNILREDMLGHLPMIITTKKLLGYGQLGLHRRFMTDFQSEIKLTMSFDAKFMEQISSNKFEYSQEQHVYEHGLEPPKKKGFFGGK